MVTEAEEIAVYPFGSVNRKVNAWLLPLPAGGATDTGDPDATGTVQEPAVCQPVVPYGLIACR